MEKWCTEGKKKEEEDNHPNQANDTELPIFSPPHPGLFQNSITDGKNFDVINLAELSDREFDAPISEPNIFLDMEALEVPSNSPPPRLRVRFDSY